MKILITGSNGFLGKNLIEKLVIRSDIEICHYDSKNSKLLLERNLRECDFLFHFAAVHRPSDNRDFYKINDQFFSEVLNVLREGHNNCPVLLTSSIQATDNNDYGRSKLMAEKILKEYSHQTGAKAIIYRLTNTFGKWAKPDSHSVVATFCYRISHDLPITVSNRDILMNFYYVDDVIESFISQLDGTITPDTDGITRLPPNMVTTISLGELSDFIYYYRNCEKNKAKPSLKTEFEKRLYYTYLSYQQE